MYVYKTVWSQNNHLSQSTQSLDFVSTCSTQSIRDSLRNTNNSFFFFFFLDFSKAIPLTNDQVIQTRGMSGFC